MSILFYIFHFYLAGLFAAFTITIVISLIENKKCDWELVLKGSWFSWILVYFLIKEFHANKK